MPHSPTATEESRLPSIRHVRRSSGPLSIQTLLTPSPPVSRASYYAPHSSRNRSKMATSPYGFQVGLCRFFPKWPGCSSWWWWTDYRTNPPSSPARAIPPPPPRYAASVPSSGRWGYPFGSVPTEDHHQLTVNSWLHPKMGNPARHVIAPLLTVKWSCRGCC